MRCRGADDERVLRPPRLGSVRSMSGAGPSRWRLRRGRSRLRPQPKHPAFATTAIAFAFGSLLIPARCAQFSWAVLNWSLFYAIDGKPVMRLACSHASSLLAKRAPLTLGRAWSVAPST